jgi:hypothetical protein
VEEQRDGGLVRLTLDERLRRRGEPPRDLERRKGLFVGHAASFWSSRHPGVTGGEPTLTVPEREEVAVPIVHVHEGLTQEQYEESVRRLAGKERMESPADWPVPGLLDHIPGEGEKGFRVVDVWESQEAVDAFAAQLMPILEEFGVQGRPEVYPTHTYVSA